MHNKRNFFKLKFKQIMCFILVFTMIFTGGSFSNIRKAKAALTNYQIWIKQALVDYISSTPKGCLNSYTVTTSTINDYKVYYLSSKDGLKAVTNVMALQAPSYVTVKYEYSNYISNNPNFITCSQNTFKSKGADGNVVGIDYTCSHGYSSSVSQRQTCTQAEITKYTCNFCGYSYTSQTKSAAGHNWSLTQSANCQHAATYRCSTCGETKTEGSTLSHSYTETVEQQQSCTKDEITKYTCKWCGISYTSTTKSAKGHSWNQTSSANCQHGTQYTCSRCGEEKTEGSPLSHNFISNAQTIQRKSCTQNEIIRYYCSYGCGQYEDKVTSQATGHNYYISAMPTIEKGTEHTCRTCGDVYYDNDKDSSYIINYNCNDTNYRNEFSVSKAAEIKDPKALTGGVPVVKDHYHYVGWVDSKGTIYTIGQTVQLGADAILTLSIKWEKNPYVVKFNANGGKGKMNDQEITSDSNVSINDNSFTKDDCHFVGWNTEKDGSGKSYSDKEIINNIAEPDEDITLYAQWEDDTYSIKYDANGGIGKINGILSVKTTDVVTIAKNSFTKEGYHFTGWNTKADGSGTDITEEQEIQNLGVNEETVILYAQWKANTYTVIFNGNGHTNLSESMDNQTFTYDSELKALSVNKFERAGYDFLGWSTDKDAKVADFDNKKEVKNLTSENDGKVILYAVWKANGNVVYTVKHYLENVKGGSYDEPEVEKFEGTTGVKVTPVTKTYVGFKTPEEQTVSVDGDGSTVVSYYYERRKYAVEVDGDAGVSQITGTGEWYYKSEQVIKADVAEGYTFDKWVDADGIKITDESSFKYTVENKKVNFSAKTKPIEYKVHFNANGGSGEMSDLDMTYGKANKLRINAFTRVGYEFKNWNTKPDGTGTAYTNEQEVKNLTKKNETTVLYAQWNAIKYNIKFAANGGSGTMDDMKDISYGTTVTLPANKFTAPGKDFVFIGWALQNSAKSADFADGGTVINLTEKDNDITLYAVWTNEKTTDYVVRHWVQNVSGDKNKYNSENYSIKESERFSAIDNETFKPAAKNYSGFEVVKNDGTKVSANNFNYVDVYYARKSYSVVISKGDDNISAVSGNKTYLYGENVTVKAEVNKDYSFYKWEQETTTANLKKRQRTSNPMTFEMPAGNVNLVVYSYKSSDGKPNDDVFNYNDETTDNSDTISDNKEASDKYVVLDCTKIYRLTKDKILKSESTDTNVAYVNDEGKLILGSDGKTYITYTTEKGSYKYYIVIEGEKGYLTIPENAAALDAELSKADAITGNKDLNEKYISLDVSKTYTVDKNKITKSESTDKNIAYINEQGKLILGNKDGSAYITYTTSDGDSTYYVVIKDGKAYFTTKKNAEKLDVELGLKPVSTTTTIPTVVPTTVPTITPIPTIGVTTGPAVTNTPTPTASTEPTNNPDEITTAKALFKNDYKSYTTSDEKIFSIDKDGNIVSSVDGTVIVDVIMQDGSECIFGIEMKDGKVVDYSSNTIKAADKNQKKVSVTVNGIVYKKVGKKVIASGVSSKYKKKSNMTIQKSVKINGKTYKVTEISNNLFKNNKYLKTLNIKSASINLKSGVFTNCKKLTVVKLQGVKTLKISKNTFKGCKKKIVFKLSRNKITKAKIKKIIKKSGLKSFVVK